MRTGSSRPNRRPTQLFVAFFIALSLASVSGCADNSPVAAPTSTLPEQEPSGGSSDEATEVAIPEYETDLDLSDEEQEAVDGALVAFNGYFRTVNEAYSGSFRAADQFPKYASGDALKSINGDVAVIKDGSYTFSGTVMPSNIEIDKVETNQKDSDVDTVIVQFCFDLSKWSLLPRDKPPKTARNESVTMEHSVRKRSDVWKVAEQTLRERKC